MRQALRVSILTAALAANISLAAGGTPESAIVTARQAFTRAEFELGPEHPVTAMMMRELALAFEQCGYHNHAEQYASRAIAVLEARFGANDVSLVPPLNVLTEAYIAEDRYSDALRTAMRAVKIGPEAGAHYGTALHNAAGALFANGRLAESEAYFKRALAARQATLPPDHPYIDATRIELKQVQKAQRLVARR
jgi:tetratricopeptide (TPR) repeat protein